ncbi:MAG: ABC transporter ATP-binding protein, partial [Acidimicrobiales bacterium]
HRPAAGRGARPVTAGEVRAEGLGLELDGRRILDGIDLVARAGAPVAVTGPSGAGKTLLLLVLAGLVAPTAGTVTVDGVPLGRALGPGAVSVGVVLQTQGVLDDLTADENVALPLQERRLAADDIDRRVAGALAAVGLEPVAQRRADELSGGQRQRVGVARALAGSPDLLVADEPTAELDSDTRDRVLALLFDPAPARVVIVASNDPEVTDACAAVIHLRDGRVDSPA